MTFEDELKALAKEARRLKADQGMVARRNARGPVLERLKRLRQALDETYPHIRKKPVSTKRLTPAAKRARLRRSGCIVVRNLPELEVFARRVGAAVHPDPEKQSGAFYVARWLRDAWNANVSVDDARTMLRSPNARQAFITQQRIANL